MAIAGVGGAIVVLSGLASIKASAGHWAITEAFLQFAKRRSVATHSFRIKAPALDDERLVVKGAGHYDFGCRPCHGSPALEQPRVARHMLPRPPDLRETARRYDPEDVFYIVKHGIKLTGMPAWPARQRDDEVWAMVAFLRRLPELDEGEYVQLARGPAGNGARVPMDDLVPPTHVPETIMDSCARCHGVDGLGRGAGAFPVLAGQHVEYLRASLDAYARGERHSGIMEPVAAPLGADEMQEVAEYYAGLTADGGATASAAGNEVERGRRIASEGLPEQLVPACLTCHGHGETPHNPYYPKLAGQSADYLRLQLTLFKEEKRGGTPYHRIMRRVATQLSEDDMRAVAAFFSTLPAPAHRH
jgi:cytochrome c553